MQVTPRDTSGQSSLDTIDRTWIVSNTGIAPSVSITTPVVMNPPTAVGALTVAPHGQLSFSGTATDDEGLANVEVSFRNSTTGEIARRRRDLGRAELGLVPRHRHRRERFEHPWSYCNVDHPGVRPHAGYVLASRCEPPMTSG